MIIIRNPYVQVLGGIFWDIKASYEAPTQEGRPGDIRLVLPYPKGQPTLQDYLNPYLDTIRTVTNDPAYPWKQVDNVLQSTVHTGSKHGWYRLKFDVAGTLTFEWNVSSESSDRLHITHNTTLLVNQGGTNNTYKPLSITIAAGDTVEFKYVKDSSGNSGQDTAYIKDLMFEPEGGIPERVYDEFNAAWQEWRDGLPLPKLSDVEQVSVNTNLLVNDGNIFGENGIFLFSALDGTLGEAEAQLFNNRTVGIDTCLSRSVVNIDGMQLICDVYVWDIKTHTWVKVDFERLPTTFKDILNISNWTITNVSLGDVSLWSNLNFEEMYTEYKNSHAHSFEESLVLSAWNPSGTDVASAQLWSQLSPIDSGTITKNDNPTPF